MRLCSILIFATFALLASTSPFDRYNSRGSDSLQRRVNSQPIQARSSGQAPAGPETPPAHNPNTQAQAESPSSREHGGSNRESNERQYEAPQDHTTYIIGPGVPPNIHLPVHGNIYGGTDSFSVHALHDGTYVGCLVRRPAELLQVWVVLFHGPWRLIYSRELLNIEIWPNYVHGEILDQGGMEIMVMVYFGEDRKLSEVVVRRPGRDWQAVRYPEGQTSWTHE